MKKDYDSLTTEEKIALVLEKSFQMERIDVQSNDSTNQESDELDPGVIRGLNAFARSLGMDDIVNEVSSEKASASAILHAERRSSSDSLANPSIVESILDWMYSVLENTGGTFANPTVAKASSGDTPLKLGTQAVAKTSDRSWKQNGIQFSLHSAGKKKFAVTLQVHETCDQHPIQLCWIEETSLYEQTSLCEDHILKFPISALDNGSYAVTIPAAVYSKRMRTILAVENKTDKGELDVRHFLPFIEFE